MLSGQNPEGGLPPKPTTAPTGTEAKVAAMAERVAAGLGCFHPADNPDCGATVEGGGQAYLGDRPPRVCRVVGV